MHASSDAPVANNSASDVGASPAGGEPELLTLVPGIETALLGNVVALLALSAVHRTWTAQDIARLVTTPVMLRQCFAFVEAGRLIGWASWANLTEEAEAGYLARTRKLQPMDWAAGDGSRIWIIDALAPWGGILSMARQIKSELRTIADQRGWPATEARWARSFGIGRVQHIGRVQG